MKLFKTVDEKFKDIGFVKVSENEFGATYSRYIEKYNYTQTLDFIHKKSGKHIVQSVDNELFDQKNIGNTCVGLTAYEMKLCLKKMRQMGWKLCKNNV